MNHKMQVLHEPLSIMNRYLDKCIGTHIEPIVVTQERILNWFEPSCYQWVSHVRWRNTRLKLEFTFIVYFLPIANLHKKMYTYYNRQSKVINGFPVIFVITMEFENTLSISKLISSLQNQFWFYSNTNYLLKSKAYQIKVKVV